MHEDLKNLNDEKQQAMDGSPATVRDEAGYINIRFQLGPVQEKGVNGTSIENVIDLLIRRLSGFQQGPFKCEENEVAVGKLLAANLALASRTKARIAQGVEGKNEPHVFVSA